MNFPTLYKKSSTGAIQEWTVSVIENSILTEWGQVGGALQTTMDVISVGKNIGKRNETTPEQQALAEAKSLFEKKLKKGYVDTVGKAYAGETDKIITGGVSPMLAHKFRDYGDRVTYPAFVQPKFDGHRCIAIVENGKATLWSRTRKPITGLPHIQRALERLVSVSSMAGKTSPWIFDGELYNHDYRNNFEDLTSFIRNPNPKPEHEVVQYHIYDLVDFNLRQFERLPVLDQVQNFGDGILVGVETLRVNDEDELMLQFEHFLEEGYEGLIVRSEYGMYVSKRSRDLLKVKKFDDAEFRIVGVEEGRGKLTGHAIFVCVTDSGQEFRAKMRGSFEALKEYYIHPEKVIGKSLTVQYQGTTNRIGVPRFPIGLRFRDE